MVKCSGCSRPVTSGKRCDVCREGARLRKQRDRDRAKASVIANYGGECVFCGNNEPIFLTIDHIGGGGNSHRKEAGEPNICLLLYREARRNGGFSAGYQVLCWSCNSAKHFHGEEAVKAAVARLRSRQNGDDTQLETGPGSAS